MRFRKNKYNTLYGYGNHGYCSHIFLMFFPSVAVKSRKTEKGQPKGCKIKEKGSH
jgi:hypothetical protein